MLELAILGLLQDEELHGYELKRRITETLGPFATVSFGSLYPALGRLEAAGAVKAVTAVERPVPAPAALPATGSLGAELAAFRARHAAAKAEAPTAGRAGKSRKVYGITEKGRALFDELLTADAASLDDDREFTLRLAFARFLPPDARIRLLERRRANLVERLARATARQPQGRGTASRDGYAAALLAHGAATTEHDISWLDGLIEAEKAGTAPSSNNPNPTNPKEG